MGCGSKPQTNERLKSITMTMQGHHFKPCHTVCSGPSMIGLPWIYNGKRTEAWGGTSNVHANGTNFQRLVCMLPFKCQMCAKRLEGQRRALRSHVSRHLLVSGQMQSCRRFSRQTDGRSAKVKITIQQSETRLIGPPKMRRMQRRRRRRQRKCAECMNFF